MSADEVTHGTDAEASRVRTGPRHAAPKKPLFARLSMPAGKAIALAAMPSAVLMGMGFTPTLARADDQPASNSMTAKEYEACVEAMTGDTSASASPTASESASNAASESASRSGSKADTKSGSGSAGKGDTEDSGSGSGGKAESSPSPTSGESASASASAEPSASATSKNLLESVGDAVSGLLGGGDSGGDDSSDATPTPTASASASPTSDAGKDAAKDTTDAVSDTVKDTVKDTAKDADKAKDTADEPSSPSATPSASPSESASPSAEATTDPEDCPAAATDDEGGVDNKLAVPEDPWYLEASSLTLKGARYKGVVEVRTASGKTKKVLKYVITEGTDIGDLHQTVKDRNSGKTYHVQAGKGTTSTITDGDTVMYTESITGNLYGLIPITFDPEHPPPLDIPLIYFTNVKVTQAGQFGGTLTVPGLHQYTT